MEEKLNPPEPEEIAKRDRGEKIGLIEEVWVPCFKDEMLEVSNLGFVRQKKDKKMRTIGKYFKGAKDREKDNYLYQVSIQNKVELIHQIVFFSFYPNLYKPDYYIKNHIDHINGIKLDNRLINLRFLNSLENSKKGNRDDSKGLF